jgi:hypothetical protein
METTANQVSAGSVSYDEAPVAQVEVEGVSYRVDAGRGSAIAVSRRGEGTWEWTPVLEGNWDGVRLKAKGLERAVVNVLEQALKAASREQAELG